MLRSFTLVELLLVISIIAILAAMLLSATVRAKQAAQVAACHNYRRQLTIYYYTKGYDDNNQEISPSYTTQKLMFEHKIIQNKCYDCHASPY